MIDPLHAVILGVVEGLTEFLPVSSTGHLILAARALQIEGEPIKTFEVVIQAGSLAAVLGLYRQRVGMMWDALCGRGTAAGRQLALNFLISFMPAALAGLLLHRLIKMHLFSTWPVVLALVAGGIVMVWLDRWLHRRNHPPARTLESLRPWEALLIGCAQCLSLWPGTSRAMVTLVAGLLVGFPATVAAEYSFLLAVPTLGAATALDLVMNGRSLWHGVGSVSMLCGFVTAAVVAVLAIRGFLRYLTHRGLAPFGWYRIGVGLLVWVAACMRH